MTLLSPLGSYQYTETQGFAAGGHQGVDLAAPTGTPVTAPAGGTIDVPAFDVGGFGNWIIEHVGNGVDLIFGHLSAINVRSGQQVAAGQQIGAVGSTGHSTGPHLHYQEDVNGVPVNPQPLLPSSTSSPASAVSADPVIAAIENATTDAHLRLALLLGANLEGGTGPGPYTPGDGGLAFGPFQIHAALHGISRAQAENPNFAVGYAINQLGYGATTAAEPAGLWATNPELAAEQAAASAERPSHGSAPQNMAYYQQGRDVHGAFLKSQSELAGAPAGSTPNATLLNLGPIPTPGDIPGAVGNALSGAIGAVIDPLRAIFVRSGLVVIGLLFILVGLVILARSGDNKVESVIDPAGFNREAGRNSTGPDLAEDAAAA